VEVRYQCFEGAFCLHLKDGSSKAFGKPRKVTSHNTLNIKSTSTLCKWTNVLRNYLFIFFFCSHAVPVLASRVGGGGMVGYYVICSRNGVGVEDTVW
jgi:hypothetical protein